MNERLGKIGSAVTGASVLAFALDMIIRLVTESDIVFMSYLASFFIAVGYVLLTASFVSVQKNKQLTAAGLAGVAFAVVYALLIFIVYYAMLTTVRMNAYLSEETLSIIKYEHLGSLFFNYNLLGYGFMGLSTFFIGFTVAPRKKSDRVLRLLLWIHGVFFISCFLMPMFPVFAPDMNGGKVIGTLVLLVWCVYFLPICILSWRHFTKKNGKH